jgi:hypothetical protein
LKIKVPDSCKFLAKVEINLSRPEPTFAFKKNMKYYLDNTFAQVKYDPSLKAVITIWKRQNTMASYKEIFKVTLQAIQENKALVYLSDINLQGAVGTDSRKWMEQEIMPKAVQSGLKQVVTIVPNDVFQKFYYNSVKKGADQKGWLDFQFFDSFENAITSLEAQFAQA